MQKNGTEQMERRYRETIAKMEHRFFEEKLRLQKEANRKISELAVKAHKVRQEKIICVLIF